MVRPPTIFTPLNESYLGRSSLRAFDEAIICCMKSNDIASSYAKSLEKSELQWSACQIIPSGISLGLSIRELIRQGHLYGALVLIRSLMERSIIILYLYKFPESVNIWSRGWNYRERPNLSEMLNKIGGDVFPNCGRDITRFLNSLSHGDPESCAWNVVEDQNGNRGYSVSKILNSPDLCDKVAGNAASLMCILLSMLHAIFPDAFLSTET